MGDLQVGLAIESTRPPEIKGALLLRNCNCLFKSSSIPVGGVGKNTYKTSCDVHHKLVPASPVPKKKIFTTSCCSWSKTDLCSGGLYAERMSNIWDLRDHSLCLTLIRTGLLFSLLKNHLIWTFYHFYHWYRQNTSRHIWGSWYLPSNPGTNKLSCCLSWQVPSLPCRPTTWEPDPPSSALLYLCAKSADAPSTLCELIGAHVAPLPNQDWIYPWLVHVWDRKNLQ
jgi:hypothetical protein